MKAWNQFTHFAGFDWAQEHHDVIIVDASGKTVADFRFEHTAKGWADFSQHIAPFPDLALAAETKSGAAIEKLLELQCCIFPVHPQSAKAYRQRKVPSGNKTDRVDAWSLADALRLDGAHWKQLSPQDPLIKELRLLCRDEVSLIRDRTALITQLRQALHEYFPAALEAFPDWTFPFAWAFVIAFPTPAALAKAGKRKWEKFLHLHKLGYPATYQRRLEIFARATEFAGAEPVANAKSRLAVTRTRQLQLLDKHWTVIAQRFGGCFHSTPTRRSSIRCPAPVKKLRRGAGRDRRRPRVVSQRAGAAMPGGHRSCQLPIRPNPSRPPATPVQQIPAAHPAPVGQSESSLLPLGRDLLHRAARQRKEPRLRSAIPGATLVEDRLEDVANASDV